MPEKIRSLFRTNPFFRGMIRVVDFGCNFEREPHGPQSVAKSDWEKIEGDWRNVGRDISTAIEKYKKDFAHAK